MDSGKRIFAQNLNQHTVLPVAHAHIPYTGSMLPLSIVTDDRIIMSSILYTTPKPIHGVLHYDSPTQIFAVGYLCGKCEHIFLVPSTVYDDTSLAKALRHSCTRTAPTLDLRTQILRIVQDIGRPGDIGSVCCEQWTDAIMELFEASR